jgi:hypothetical protein
MGQKAIPLLMVCSISEVLQEYSRSAYPKVDGIEILREIHEGECGYHAAAKSLVAKAFLHGFY